MRVGRTLGTSVLAIVIAGCEATAPTPVPPTAGPEASRLPPTPSAARPSTAPTEAPISGGSALFFATPRLPMGTIGVGATAEATLELVDLGSSPVTGLRVALDERLAPGAGVEISPLGTPCTTDTIDVGERCPLVVRAAPIVPLVNGSLLVTVTGDLEGRPVVTYATVTLQASAWTTEPIDEESLPDASEAVQVRAASTLGGVVTEHRVDGVEEGLQGEDATEYRNREEGSTRWRNSSVLPGIFGAVAAAEGRVHVAMESYRCGGGGIGVMRNLDNGARRSWSGTTCLTRAADQMSTWAPAIAASGHHVYVVAQRTGTDRIEMWRSGDDGRTWTRTHLGRTGHAEEGLPPIVAAFGDTVLVVWTRGPSTVARQSDDSGRSWQARETVGPGEVLVATRDGDQLLVMSGGGSVHGWTSAGGWRRLSLPRLNERPCVAPIVSPGPGSVLALSCTAESSAGMYGASWWSWSTDGSATWAPFEPLPGLGGTAPTTWTADGRPQLQLWETDEEDGGPVMATRSRAAVVP